MSDLITQTGEGAGAVAVPPVATAPVAAATELAGLVSGEILPCFTAPKVRFCSSVGTLRVASTPPYAVCPPMSRQELSQIGLRTTRVLR
jgi:hypothetical protein